MSKYKATRKEIKERYDVYSIGNGNLQYLLNYKYPFAYSTRAEGWACDYYDVGKGVVLCDGYAPIGKKIKFDTMSMFDQKAKDIFEEFHWEDPEKCKSMLDNLIADFVGTIKGGDANV